MDNHRSVKPPYGTTNKDDVVAVERSERIFQCWACILLFSFIRDLVSQLLIIIRVGDKRLNTIDIGIGLPLNFLCEIFRTAAP